MKLSVINDNWSRRDFLRTVGTSAISPRSILDTLLKMDSSYVRAIREYRKYQKAGGSIVPLREIMFNIVNNHERPQDGVYDITGWSVTQPGFEKISPDVVVGCMLDETDDSDPADILNQFNTGDDLKAFDAIPGYSNLRSDILNAMSNKFDFADVLQSLQNHWANENFGVDDEFWNQLEDLTMIPKYTADIGISATQLERLRGTQHGVRVLLKKGLIDKDVARVEIIKTQRAEYNAQKFKERRERERIEYQKDQKAAIERHKKAMEKARKRERYQVPQDYSVASPMHQWFEESLDKILIKLDPLFG